MKEKYILRGSLVRELFIELVRDRSHIVHSEIVRDEREVYLKRKFR